MLHMWIRFWQIDWVRKNKYAHINAHTEHETRDSESSVDIFKRFNCVFFSFYSLNLEWTHAVDVLSIRCLMLLIVKADIKSVRKCFYTK